MKWALDISTALLAIGTATAALAGPNTVHKSISMHSDGLWTENNTWETVGGTIPDDPNLDTEWFADAADFLPDMMFSFDAMDAAMTPLFAVDVSDLTSHGMSITRSEAGLPLTLDVTINSETWTGGDGFALELEEPVPVTMIFVKLTNIDGDLLLALYEGMMDGAVYTVSHNALAAGPQTVMQESPALFELEILTTQFGLCPGDIADDLGNLGGDAMVSFGDFLAMLGLIGPCPGPTPVPPGCVGDIADDFGNIGGDAMVSFGDFLALLGLIGPCP